MQSDPLDDLLCDYFRQPAPSVPRDLSAGIHAEIHRRQRQSFWRRVVPLLDWIELFREPRLAVPALVCALTIGILSVAMSAKSRADLRLARQSIHFNVFSTLAAPQLTPSTGERVTVPPFLP